MRNAISLNTAGLRQRFGTTHGISKVELSEFLIDLELGSGFTRMNGGDFVKTIDSDDELPINEAENQTDKIDFEFDLDLTDGLATESLDEVRKGSIPNPISVDDIIASRRKRKRFEVEQSSESDSETVASNDGEMDEDIIGSIADGEETDPLATSGEDDVAESSDADQDGGIPETASQSDSEAESETQADRDRKAAYFAQPDSGSQTGDVSSFLTMNLSRPILKAVTSLSFKTPTPIQAATIPAALLGKDIVGNAVTGSGKTASFIIPILERMMYRERSRRAAATRCLILTPTRELAVQCFEVGIKLAAYTDVRFCLVVGGLSLKEQEASLRTRPDIVIATPGRLIDHLRNAPSFHLDALDVLVLDEADRMLQDGFAEELTEIVKACPKSRQTMLFSATMTDSVDELVRMSLNTPVRLFVDPKRSTAKGLVQEFVRVRAGRELERSALLVALCKRTFQHRVIVFVRSKKLAHQLRVVFSILEMKTDELHGDLTQEQRLNALHRFRDGEVDYLIATDLAARGLDIKGVETVINYDMPGQLAQYLHRVGRTARAGHTGRSVTLVGEADRKMLKAVMKHSAGEDQVRQRLVPPEALSKSSSQLDNIKEEVAEVLKEEKLEKEIRRGEMEIKKGENIIQHHNEIFSRPQRTWFQNEHQKAKAKELSQKEHTGETVKGSKTEKDDQPKPKRDKLAGLSRKAKRRKLAMEEDAALNDSGVVQAAVRSAKKAIRPTKIGQPEARIPSSAKRTKARKARKALKVGFETELGARGEGARAQRGDSVKGFAPKSRKGGSGKSKSKRHSGKG